MNHPDLIATAAKIAYEANRALCVALGETFVPEPWDEASQEARNSVMDGTAYVLDHIFMSPEENHERWLARRRADGWVYGPLKNPVTKEHPDIVNWEDLRATSRAKNELFLGIVRALDGLSDGNPADQPPAPVPTSSLPDKRLRPSLLDAHEHPCRICDRPGYYADDEGELCPEHARAHPGWHPAVRMLSYAIFGWPETVMFRLTADDLNDAVQAMRSKWPK